MDKVQRLFSILTNLIDKYNAQFVLVNASLVDQIEILGHEFGRYILQKEVVNEYSDTSIIETIRERIHNLQGSIEGYREMVYSINQTNCEDVCPITLFSNISRRTKCQENLNSLMQINFNLYHILGNKVANTSLYNSTCLNNDSCNANGTNVSSFISLANSFVQMGRTTLSCLNEYFHFITDTRSYLIKDQTGITSSRYFDIDTNIDKEYEVLFGNKASLEVLINRYIASKLTKKQMAEILQDGTLQRAIENIDTFVERLNHEIMTVKRRLQEYKTHIHSAYVEMIKQAVDLAAYLPSGIMSNKIQSLSIWTRPILIIEGNAIDIDFSQKSLNVSNAMMKAFVDTKVNVIIKEHVDAYFENGVSEIENVEEGLRSMQRQLKTSIMNVDARLKRYTKENALNENFVL